MFCNRSNFMHRNRREFQAASQRQEWSKEIWMLPLYAAGMKMRRRLIRPSGLRGRGLQSGLMGSWRILSIWVR